MNSQPLRINKSFVLLHKNFPALNLRSIPRKRFIIRTKSHQHFFLRLGKNFGYPLCCIQSFIRSTGFLKLQGTTHGKKIEKSIFNGTGFIPCKCCINKDPKILIQKINSHRNPRLHAFPNDD